MFILLKVSDTITVPMECEEVSSLFFPEISPYLAHQRAIAASCPLATAAGDVLVIAAINTVLSTVKTKYLYQPAHSLV